MDSVAFARAHQDDWDRLQDLTRKRHLSGAEADEFVQLYHSAAAQLAALRAHAPDPDVVLTLSAIVSGARSRLTAHPTRSVKRFVRLMPYAFYRIRWWILAVTVLCIAVGAITLIHIRMNPELLNLFGPEPMRRHYATEAFSAYYSEYASHDFSIIVWTNNAWIAVQCVAGGITGIYPLLVLLMNSATIGQAGAVLDSYGMLDIFFQLILPHGLMELTAIFIAGAAGIRLFWKLLMPGGVPRTVALAHEGIYVLTICVGLVAVLFVSGLVEGFVTPSQLHWGVKIAIGVLVLTAFWLWVIIGGRSARRQDIVVSLPHKEYAV